VARAGLIALGLVLIAGGGAAVGYSVTRPPVGGTTPEQTAAIAAAIGSLDGDLKAARAGVADRAQTFSELPSARAAVSTDADTVKDMVSRGELKFDPKPGEVIELGQLRADGPAVLAIQPEGGAHTTHAGAFGHYTDMAGNKLAITEVVEVKPTTAGGLRGYISVSRPLELTTAVSALAQAGVSGRFELAGETMSIGGPLAANAVTTTQTLPSEPNAKLTVATPPPVKQMPFTILAAGATGFGIGLILMIIGFVKRSPATSGVAPNVHQAVTVPGGGSAETRYSQPIVAQGTPSSAGFGDAGNSLVNPANIGAGAMIGRWEVIRRLGSGGMADVYLARARGDAGFEKLVALKVMHGHLARNQRAVDHFLDEARLAARVVHPNVVAIQDLGKIGSDYVIVMEYVDGIDLERLLAQSRAAGRLVPIPVGLAILSRICDGLNAAHKATAPDGTRLNIVHRDVKAANVLVSKQGQVKVVDFGIAKAATQSHLTIAGETKGTPSMMAPEQRVGEQVDVRADVYSVAAVGFEVLTGNGVNLDLAALAHLGVENWPHLPPPSQLRADLPKELDQLLLGAMAFDRDKRPADCAAFEQAFESVAKQYSLTASDKDIARWVDSELAALPPSARDGSPHANA
jgi:hypothetical protein